MTWLTPPVPGPGGVSAAGTPLSNPPRKGRRRPARIPRERFLGVFAATDTAHQFVSVDHSSSCWACFGWYDDPRHINAPPTNRKGRTQR